MLTHFFYTHSTWLVGLVVVGVWTGLSLAGLCVFHRLSDVHKRHKDTETVGLTYAIVAVVYAVLIGFIVVNVFETFAKGDEVATAEANQLSNLLSDSTGTPPEISRQVHDGVDQYIDLVTKTEWPAQQEGNMDEKVFEPGWSVLGDLGKKIAAFEPATAGQNVNKGAMLHAMDDLLKARRGRIAAANDHVPDVVWQILILAGAVAVAYTYLFGAHSFKIHLAITGLIAATISLVFVLIIALDYPFRGDVSISDEAFISVRATASDPASETPEAKPAGESKPETKPEPGR